MARTQLKPAPQPQKPAAAPEPPPVAANSSEPPARPDAAGVPPITTENPWRHLHPARVWPD